IAAIVDETKPDVLVTYNEIGFYGHPDHIRAHEATLAARVRAGHRARKLYFNAVPKSLLLGGREMASQLGVSPDDFFSLEEIERIGSDDDVITTAIDVAAYVDRKFHALEAHRTQLGTTEQYLRIPEDVRALAMGAEYYVLADGGRTGETDLFEGL